MLVELRHGKRRVPEFVTLAQATALLSEVRDDIEPTFARCPQNRLERRGNERRECDVILSCMHRLQQQTARRVLKSWRFVVAIGAVVDANENIGKA